jgi:hypothetical protein
VFANKFGRLRKIAIDASSRDAAVRNRRSHPCSVVQVGRVIERAAGGAVRLFQLPINPLTGPTCRLLNVADEDGRLGDYTISFEPCQEK